MSEDQVQSCNPVHKAPVGPYSWNGWIAEQIIQMRLRDLRTSCTVIKQESHLASFVCGKEADVSDLMWWSLLFSVFLFSRLVNSLSQVSADFSFSSWFNMSASPFFFSKCSNEWNYLQSVVVKLPALRPQHRVFLSASLSVRFSTGRPRSVLSLPRLRPVLLGCEGPDVQPVLTGEGELGAALFHQGRRTTACVCRVCVCARLSSHEMTTNYPVHSCPCHGAPN